MLAISVRLRLPAAALVLLFAAGSARGEQPREKLPCWYTVKRGDTLARIARRYYGRTEAWKRIKQANPKVNVRFLDIGQRIYLPAPEGQAAPPPPPAPEHPPPASPATPESPGAVSGFAFDPEFRTWVLLPFGFIFSVFTMWFVSRKLRNALRLRKTSFWAALRATGLMFMHMTLFAAGAVALVVLPIVCGLTNRTAITVLISLASIAVAPAWIWGACAGLRYGYKIETRAAAVLLVAWLMLTALLSAILAGLWWLAFGLPSA